MKLFRRKSAGTSPAQAPDGAALAGSGSGTAGLQPTPEASATEMLSFRRTLTGGEWAPSVPFTASAPAPSAAPPAGPADAAPDAAADEGAGPTGLSAEDAESADNVASLPRERPAVAPAPAAAVVDKYVTSRPQGPRAPSQPPQSPFSNSARRQPPRSARAADSAEAEADTPATRPLTSRPKPSQPRSYQSRVSQPFVHQSASAPPQPAAPPPSATPEPPAEASAAPTPDTAPESLPDLSLVEMPGATAGRTARRAGRVKTRLMGFEHSSDASDPFAAAAAQDADETATPETRRCPVGWIVVVGGPGRGASFTLFSGVSPIGRGSDQTIRLDFGDTAISRNSHAVVAYDPEQRKYFLGHGGKANIVRLNDMPVLSTEELKDGDEIRIGETALRFVAFCKDGFDWRDSDEGETGDVDGL